MRAIRRFQKLICAACVVFGFPVFASDLTNLMPLEVDPDLSVTVTPTHTAVLSGDWSNPSIWGAKDVSGLPGKGAIVYIPGFVHVTASGVLNDESSAFFMVRVDGELTLSALNGVATVMYVDTLFTNQMPSGEGKLSIDAQSSSGTVDLVLTPFDIRKSKGGVGWPGDAQKYYTDGAPVTGWNGTPVEDDGPGVLGRYEWDPAQLSLGIVVHGEADFQGSPVGAHGAAVAVIEGTIGKISGIVGFEMKVQDAAGWEAGQTVLVTSMLFTLTETDDPTRNAVSHDTTAEITEIVPIDGDTVAVSMDRALDLDTFGPRSYSDGSTHFPVIGNLDRSIRIYSSVAVKPEGGFSRPESIDNPPAEEETLGINGSLTGDNGHKVTQRGHFMAMHTDDVEIRYVSFGGMGRTDKSALIDDFQPAPVDAEGTIFLANGQNSGLFVGKKSLFKRLYEDGNGNARFDGREVDPPRMRAVDTIVNQRGRYSVHIHRAGVAPRDDSETELDSAWIEGVVVWDAPGWAFVHHDSEAVMANNISYNAVGVGFMSETGNENGVWYRNLSSTNTGFLNGEVDAPSSHEMNDVGRRGAAFWMEGRNLALFDNVATGSNVGYLWQPWGVDNIDTSIDGLSRINAILAHPDMSGILAEAGVEIDPMMSKLGSISLDGSGAKNTNVPIRYFQGNRSVANESGIIIGTGPGLADRKFNDAWSVFRDFTAVETFLGVSLGYTSKYLVEDFRMYGAEAPSSKDNAFEFSSSTSEMTVKDVWVERENVASGVRFNSRTGNPQVNLNGMRDLRGGVGVSAVEPEWEALFEGFSNPGLVFHPLVDGHTDGAVYNPYHNFYGINILEDPIDGPNGGLASFGASSTIQVDFADDMIELPALIEGGVETTLPFRISTSEIPDLPEPVSITLADDSAELGVVGLWRENQLAAGYSQDTNQPFVFLNDFIARRLYFDDGNFIRGVRAYLRNDPGRINRLSRLYRQDVWSGALLEFDKTDPLGSQRFAYSEGEPFLLGTHNERLVFSRAMINKTLEQEGYFTLDGVEFINQQGEPELMKFVQMPKLFTDRSTGDLHEKTFIVALDEAWGSDGSVDWVEVPVYDFDPYVDATESHVIAEQYGHYLDGVYQGQTLEFPQAYIVNGTDERDYIDFEYVDVEGDVLRHDREVVLAGLGENDEIEGSLGADVIDGGEGTNDRVNYTYSNVAVHLNTETGVHRGGYAEGDVLRNLEVFRLTRFHDTFIGSDRNEVVWPGDGRDRVETRGGDDSVRIIESSGIFSDYIDVGDGTDGISMKGGIPYTLFLTHDLNAPVNIVDAEVIGGHLADDVIDVIDTTTAGDGAQRNLRLIRGHAGDDEIRVTMVKVDLEGQSGNETFHFNHAGYNHFDGAMDITVLDFNVRDPDDTQDETLMWRGQVIDLANPEREVTVACDEEGLNTILTLGNDGTVRLQGGCFLPTSAR